LLSIPIWCIPCFQKQDLFDIPIPGMTALFQGTCFKEHLSMSRDICQMSRQPRHICQLSVKYPGTSPVSKDNQQTSANCQINVKAHLSNGKTTKAHLSTVKSKLTIVKAHLSIVKGQLSICQFQGTPLFPKYPALVLNLDWTLNPNGT
jgi:hypothetical protein